MRAVFACRYPTAARPAAVAVLAIALAVSLALAREASAQDPPAGDDLVGIYTGDFTGPTASHHEGLGLATVYIVLSGLPSLASACGLAGWELRVDLEGFGAQFAAAVVRGQGPINLYAPPVFQVGFAAALPVEGPQGSCTVAMLDYLVVGTEPTRLYIRSIASSASIPGQPCYACACDICELTVLTPSSGSQDLPVFGFNTGPLAIPVQGRTWGAVKGLYR